MELQNFTAEPKHEPTPFGRRLRKARTGYRRLHRRSRVSDPWRRKQPEARPTARRATNRDRSIGWRRSISFARQTDCPGTHPDQIVRSADLDAVPGIIDDGPIGGVRLPRERFQRGNHAFAVEIIRSKHYSSNNRSGEQSCSSPKRPAVGRARNRWGSGRCQGALQVRLTDSGRATTGAGRAHLEPKPSKKGKIFQRQSNLGVSWSPPSS
jgi:hypothetical protein